MKKQDLVDSIPLAILLVAIFYTLITTSTTNIVISTKHYIGFLLVSISTILFFINRKLSEILIGVTIFIGLFGLAAFLPTIYSISIAGLKLQSFPLIIIFITVMIIYYKYKDDTNSNLQS